MDNHMEIVNMNNGSWVLLDVSRCEWVIGFAKEDQITVTFMGNDDNHEVSGNVMDVYDSEAGNTYLKLFTEGCIMIIPELRILNIERGVNET